jgi:hypothetical protein
VRAASILKWCVCQLKRVKASSLVSWLDLWPPPPYINSRARVVHSSFGRERRVRTRKAISIRCYYVVINFPYFYTSCRRRIHFDYMTGGVKLDQAKHFTPARKQRSLDFLSLFSSFGIFQR